MNTLLFLASGFSVLSFLRSSEEEKYPSAILKETIWVFFGICLFSGLSFIFRRFLTLQILEIEILVAVIFFILMLALGRDISMFAAVSGLGFWVLEYASSWSRAAAGVLAAGALYTVFRLAIWSFQNRSLFYKPAAPFAGHSLLMIQAFWASLILSVLSLLFNT